MEIVPGVHSIGPTSAGLLKGGYVHAYLFVRGNELTLVDTGWDDDAHVILNYLWSIGRSPTELKHIAITHAHRSHLGGLATLQGVSGAKVYAHRAEAPIIQGQKRARPVSLAYLRPFVLYPFRILALVDLPKHVPCEVTEVLGDENHGPVGGLKVIYTPGHTEGHLAFYHVDHRVLIAGDAVATWPTFSAGWPGFNQDQKLYEKSLAKLIAMEPRYVGTGHGDPIVNAAPTRIDTLLPSRFLR
ncbi:MAG: MBL fold metallo-hydrolase [Mycobacteriaceae bacterium]|nr:MBL fold metallo-hydrolase [Mycobacteriaceae bacterium]